MGGLDSFWIPNNERDCYERAIRNHQVPNQQFTIRWSCKRRIKKWIELEILWLPHRKLAWQWKITIFNRRYIFKWLSIKIKNATASFPLLCRVVTWLFLERLTAFHWRNWATFKTLLTFHYTGWLIGILIMVYEIIPIQLGKKTSSLGWSHDFNIFSSPSPWDPSDC